MRFDPETLREIADPFEAWTQIGVNARMVGELALAERALSHALSLRPSTAARLRLAHVYQWQERFAEAHAEFARCLESGEITDFVHQHWGKCYFDEGRYAEALTHFRAALELRDGGDPSLVESTLLAIAAAERKLAPAWAFEKAQVVPHDPAWAARAQAERARLLELLEPWLVDGVEHCGSTAVPGLAAKPIVDLMASVTDLDVVVGAASDLLAADGWSYVSPDLDGRPWRRFFVKPDATGERREAHLHLIRAGHHRWADQLRFRDALRADASLAQRYEQLKHRLSAANGHDREAYTEGKAEFVASVLASSRGQ